MKRIPAALGLMQRFVEIAKDLKKPTKAIPQLDGLIQEIELDVASADGWPLEMFKAVDDAIRALRRLRNLLAASEVVQ